MAEPRMARRDHPEPRGQTVEKRAVLRDVVTSVQKQQRRAGSGNLGVDRDAADLYTLHPTLARIVIASAAGPAVAAPRRACVAGGPGAMAIAAGRVMPRGVGITGRHTAPGS